MNDQRVAAKACRRCVLHAACCADIRSLAQCLSAAAVAVAAPSGNATGNSSTGLGTAALPTAHHHPSTSVLAIALPVGLGSLAVAVACAVAGFLFYRARYGPQGGRKSVAGTASSASQPMLPPLAIDALPPGKATVSSSSPASLEGDLTSQAAGPGIAAAPAPGSCHENIPMLALSAPPPPDGAAGMLDLLALGVQLHIQSNALYSQSSAPSPTPTSTTEFVWVGHMWVRGSQAPPPPQQQQREEQAHAHAHAHEQEQEGGSAQQAHPSAPRCTLAAARAEVRALQVTLQAEGRAQAGAWGLPAGGLATDSSALGGGPAQTAALLSARGDAPLAGHTNGDAAGMACGSSGRREPAALPMVPAPQQQQPGLAPACSDPYPTDPAAAEAGGSGSLCEALQLGPVLGRGRSGASAVHQGVWRTLPVAVKVVVVRDGPSPDTPAGKHRTPSGDGRSGGSGASALVQLQVRARQP